MRNSYASIAIILLNAAVFGCDKCNDTGVIETYDTNARVFATKPAAALHAQDLNQPEFEQQEARLQSQLNSGGSGSVIGKKSSWVPFQRADGNFGVRRMTPTTSKYCDCPAGIAAKNRHPGESNIARARREAGQTPDATPAAETNKESADTGSHTEIAELEMQLPALRAYLQASTDTVEKASIQKLIDERSARFKTLVKLDAVTENFRHNTQGMIDSLLEETRDHENALAELMLGAAYCVGNGVTPDYDAAVKHIAKAIEIERTNNTSSPGVPEFLRFCQENASLAKSKKAEESGDLIAASNGYAKLAASPFPEIRSLSEQALKKLRANPAVAAKDRDKQADKALTNAMNYANNRMFEDAVDMLQTVIRDYPDSGAAKQAALELQKLKNDGVKVPEPKK